MEQFLYLTTQGWRTGSPHQIEIWFVDYEGRFYMVAETRQHAHWVQNIQHNPAVTFRVGETTYQGTGRLVESEPELKQTIRTLMEQKYEWGDGLIVELTPA
jgi:deazaflavin-dependent oxidoreductase (nitroreductase family)